MNRVVFVLLVALCATAAVAQISPQRNDFHGWYYTSGCFQWGNTALGVYAKSFMQMHNNGYSARINLYINNPTCAGGFDIELSKFGVVNFDMGQVTNTVGATNIDFGQDVKLFFAVTQTGATLLTNQCNPPFPIMPNTMVPADRLNCPDLWVVPFEVCPMHYTIGLKTGNQLQTAVPGCDAAHRPTTLVANTGMHTQIMNIPIWIGVWQPTTCFYDAQRQMSYSSEFQIMHQGYYSMAFFGYSSPNCDISTLAVKGNMGGFFETLAPADAPAGAFNVEMDRFGHTIYITSQSVLDSMNQQAAACGIPAFQLNVLTDLRNVTCPALYMSSIESCPKLYDIGALVNGQLYFGTHTHQFGAMCSPANRATTLNSVGLINVMPMPWMGGSANVGAVVVLVLLVIALVGAGAWIVYRHRGNSVAACQQLCCGQRASYSESA